MSLGHSQSKVRTICRPQVEALEDRLVPTILTPISWAGAPALAADFNHDSRADAVLTITCGNATVGSTGLQNGLSPEFMNALAKELNANAWLSMPHTADDDYVRSFIQAVQKTLASNLLADQSVVAQKAGQITDGPLPITIELIGPADPGPVSFQGALNLSGITAGL